MHAVTSVLRNGASVLRGGVSGLRDGVSVLRDGASGLRGVVCGLRGGASVLSSGLAARAGEAGVDGRLLHVWQGHTAQSCHCMQHLLPPLLLEGRGHRDRGQATAS